VLNVIDIVSYGLLHASGMEMELSLRCVRSASAVNGSISGDAWPMHGGYYEGVRGVRRGVEGWPSDSPYPRSASPTQGRWTAKSKTMGGA